MNIKVKKRIFIIIMIVLCIMIGYCNNVKKEHAFKNINNLEEEMSILIKDFNNLTNEQSKELLKASFISIEKTYSKIYSSIEDIKYIIQKDTYNYFKNEYTTAYTNLSNNFNYFVNNTENISNQIFLDEYNKVGKSINEFVDIHNNFIKMLSNQ